MRITKLGFIGVGALLAGSAVFGSATGITNAVDKLGGSSAQIATCDASIGTSIATAYEPGISEYEVTTVTITGIDDTACDGAVVKVTLSDVGGAAVGTEVTSTAIASGDTSKILTFSTQNLSAVDATQVNVLLAGG